MLVFFQGRVVR